jgi:hypothetical protein
MAERLDDDAVSAPGAARILLARPRRRAAGFLLVVALVTGLGCWYFGADVWHAAAIGTAVLAPGLIWIALPESQPAEWPREAAALAEGSRREVMVLSWSLRPRYGSPYGRVRGTALRRVRELAQTRLALHHLDLRNPDDQVRIERLIGAANYAMLHAGGQRLPTLRAVARCVDALEMVDALEISDRSNRRGR